MGLAEGIQRALVIKGITSRELIKRVPADGGRWAAYRVLSGRSGDPRVSTFVLLCTALDISPTELLQLADLWPRIERADTPADIRLREVFRAIQDLETDSRELATLLLDAVTQALRMREGGPGSGRP